MISLIDLLILSLGSRFAKLLAESWLGKEARPPLDGDVLDVFKGRIQSTADQKKAIREFEELGDRIARELIPLFEGAEKWGHVNEEAVVLALESTLAGLMNSSDLNQKDLDPGAIVTGLKQARPLPAAQFSQAETELYERALESSVRHLVELAARLPRFEDTFISRSLQQLSRLTGNVDEILVAVRRIEVTVGVEARGDQARQYEIEYRLAVRRNLDYLEIFGIDLPPEARSQKLSVAYISLNLDSHSGESAKSLPAEALFDRLSTSHGRLLIRGDAGTGKSTLFRWAAMQAAAGLQGVDFGDVHERDWKHLKLAAEHSRGNPTWRARVPFLIRLRQCTSGLIPSPNEFPDFVTQALGSPPEDWVKAILKEGRALLLLDGVDEIPNAHRDTTRRGIADLVAQYPDNYFVINTRPRAVDLNWLVALDFQEASINPLSDLDRTILIKQWYLAVAEELKQRGKTTAGLSELADSLGEKLKDNPEFAHLASTPLLCAIICALYRDRGERLPESQRELCEALCQMLLHRRERESGLNFTDFPEPYRRLDYPQKRAAVQELAHYMVLNEYSSLSCQQHSNFPPFPDVNSPPSSVTPASKDRQ